MEYQERYWRELDQLKVHVFYLENYLERTVNFDRSINMFLAIASSTSISGWVIWQEYSFFWGLVIAISQMLGAIKIFLPYSKRLKALQIVTQEMESLFITMEDSWFNVSEGLLTKEEIHKTHMFYKERRRKVIQKYLSAVQLPVQEDMIEDAQQKAQEYFKNFYGLQ